MSQSVRRLLLLFGLAAVYFFAAKLGLRVWPAILGAAFLANVTTTGGALPSIGIAIGNTAEGLLGSYLVNRFARGGRVFDRVGDILRFTALAAIVSTTVSATLGVF